LIVSNRLPLTITIRKSNLSFQPSTGGLATALASIYKSHDSLWIGWPGINQERIKEEQKKVLNKKLEEENCHPVFLSRHEVENYYHGFCNKTIWPLFHYFPTYALYNKNLWNTYTHVNQKFSDSVTQVARKDDIIWVHDYQLMLLPGLIREKIPDATIGFSLHIPFPTFELFRLLPWRKEVLKGLLGADLLGFHTYDYVRHFTSTTRWLLGYEQSLGHISVHNRVIRADAFPMGINYERFAKAADESRVKREIQRIRNILKERKIILSVDRLDYTKGIPQRLEVFDLFLEKNPQYRGQITLVLVAVPSRTGVERYMILKKQIDELVGKINGKYGIIGWVPIWYLYRSLPFYSLVALYNIANIALVTPLRDGMNLIAKEFITTKTDGRGVLILSEMAGAATELGEAIIINPNNKERMVEALKQALNMEEEEQIERNRIMQKRLQRYDVKRWVGDFLDRLSFIKGTQKDLFVKKFSSAVKEKLVSDFLTAGKRLLLLDYDGTLISFADKPEKAKPDEEISALVKKLTQSSKNEVVIISGRDKETLQHWFKDSNVGLVAEHGVWIKDKGKDWEMIEPLKDEWKEEIRPLLELYVDRTPGSFIEEKDYSLVWHYRKANTSLADVRTCELKEALFHLAGDFHLAVLEGNKVIEIKDSVVNKGRAALRWVSQKKWDFILAIGDDWTDEDIFSALPHTAYSLKVGLSPSKARFNIGSSYEVRELLKELVKREK
jgi:trehalose 6-phosphate synthase/phosphatase